MTFNTNFNTTEAQAIREQFRQEAKQKREAVKNAPPKIKQPKE